MKMIDAPNGETDRGADVVERKSDGLVSRVYKFSYYRVYGTRRSRKDPRYIARVRLSRTENLQRLIHSGRP